MGKERQGGEGGEGSLTSQCCSRYDASGSAADAAADDDDDEEEEEEEEDDVITAAANSNCTDWRVNN